MKHYTRREPDKYIALTITEDMPIQPDTVKHILDQMPRKIETKRVRFNASFGISPEQLSKEIRGLPLTARVLTIDTVTRGYITWADITYYRQPEKKPRPAND